VFLVNVPIAALGILAALLIIPESHGSLRRPDPLGALLSMAGMTALVWTIISGPNYGWGDAWTFVAIPVAVVMLVGFVMWERTCAEPMLPIGLFRGRNFSGASLSVVLLSFAGGGILLAITQFLQFVLGYSAIKAGAALMPLIVTAMVFNGVGVAIDKKLGARITVAIGLFLVTIGFALFASISPGDGYSTLIAALILTGAGSGTAGPAAYGTLLGSLPPDRAGVGSAVNDTVQQVGQALSVAILGSVLTATYASNMPDNIGSAARHSLGDALGIAAATHNPGLAHTAKNAFVTAMSTTAYAGIAGGIAAVIVALVVLHPTRKPAPTEEPEPVPTAANTEHTA
jgi:hypothetical protein